MADDMILEDVEAGIRENIRLGYIVEVSPGRFSMTEAGIKHVESMPLPTPPSSKGTNNAE